jgi:tetratricopeptide (TPR) repeat protein
MDRHAFEKAIAEYLIAVKVQPENMAPLVNASLAYNALGQNDKAEASLRQALTIEPTNTAANLNLGLLLGEVGKLAEASQAFRAALKSDPRNAVAAYNLAVLVARTNPEEAIELCRRAATLRPLEPKYGYTLAFFQRQTGKTKDAIQTLEQLIKNKPAAIDPYMLLGQIYEELGRIKDALGIYRQAVTNDRLPAAERGAAIGRIRELSQ